MLQSCELHIDDNYVDYPKMLHVYMQQMNIV